MIYNEYFLRTVCYFIARNATPFSNGALIKSSGHTVIGNCRVSYTQYLFIERGLVAVGYLEYGGRNIGSKDSNGQIIRRWVGPTISRPEDFTDEMLRRIDEAADQVRKETHRRVKADKLKKLTENERTEKARILKEQINALIATLKELGYQVAFDCSKM